MVSDVLINALGMLSYFAAATGFAMSTLEKDDNYSSTNKGAAFAALIIIFPFAVVAGLSFKLGKYVSR